MAVWEAEVEGADGDTYIVELEHDTQPSDEDFIQAYVSSTESPPPAEEPEPQEGTQSALLGMAQRGLQLAAGIPKGLRIAGEFIEEPEKQVSVGGMPINPALWIPPIAAEAEKFLEEEIAEVNFIPEHQWEEVKEDPTKFPSWFIDKLAVMAPDFAALATSAPAYFMANVGPYAEERATHRARATGEPVSVTPEDFATGTAISAASTGLDVLGMRGMGIGKALPVSSKFTRTPLARGLTGAGTETATELAQTAIEYTGTRAGTGADIDPSELGSLMEEAAVVAGIVGGGVPAAQQAIAKRPPKDFEPETDAITRYLESTLPPPEAPTPTTPHESRQEAKAIRREEEAVAEPPPERPAATPRPAERVEPAPAKPERVSVPPSKLNEVLADPSNSVDEVRNALMDDIAMQAEKEVGDALYKDVPVVIKERIADIEALADKLGLTPEEVQSMTKGTRQTRAAMAGAVSARGLETKLNPDGTLQTPQRLVDIMEDAKAGIHALTGVQQHAVVQHIAVRDMRIAALLNRGALEPPHRLKEISEAIRKERAAIVEANVAFIMGRRELGRGLGLQAARLRTDMSLEEMLAEARVEKRKDLTEAQTKSITKKYVEITKEINEATRNRERAQAVFDKAEAMLERLKGVDALTPKALKAQARLEKIKGKAERQIVDADLHIEEGKDAKDAIVDEVSSPVSSALRSVFGLSRAFRASYDQSVLGRQALFMAAGSPKVMAIKAFPSGVIAALSPVRARKMNQAIMDGRVYNPLTGTTKEGPPMAVLDAMGIEFTEAEGISNIAANKMARKEETAAVRYMSNYAPIRLLHRVFMTRGSQNAFATALNVMRQAEAKKWLSILESDYDVDSSNVQEFLSKVPPEELRGFGAFINMASGRPTSEWGRRLMRSPVGSMMMAPGFTASRIEGGLALAQLVSPERLGVSGPFQGMSAKNRARLLRSIALRSSALLGTALGLTIANSSDSELDDNIMRFMSPDSGDWLKAKVDNTRVDFTSGMGTTWRYMLPFIWMPNKGMELVSQKKFYGDLQRLAINKSHPVWQAAAEMAFNQGYRGQELARRTDHLVGRSINRYVLPAMKAYSPITLEEATEVAGRYEPAREALPTIEEFAAPEGRERRGSPDLTGEEALAIPLLNFFGLGTTHYRRSKRSARERKGR